MKQLVIPRFGPPEVLVVRDGPDPLPAPGQVVIRVRAAGLNFADVMARQGLYPDAPPLPCVVGYEVAGEVESAAPEVTAPRPGDRVIAMTRFGGQAERVAVLATRAVALPAGWSYEEGAALPVNYLTAHHMLVRVAGAQPGETVLVHSAAGGVGIAVAQLGRILGLRLIGLASPAKHGVLRALGVEPHDSRDPRWWEAIRRAAPGGVDIALDAVGGDSWRRSYALLAPAGRLVCFGAAVLSSGTGRRLPRTLWHLARSPWFHPLPLMSHNRAVAGVNLGHLWGAERLLRPQLDALLGYARSGQIRPRVDRAFPLAEGRAAHQYLQDRRSIGKVVLLP